MAQTRLTVAIKDKIVKELIAHAFTERSNDIAEAERAFVLDVYDDYVATRTIRYEGSKKDVPLRDAIKALPYHWRTHKDHFRVEFAGDSQDLHTDKGLSEGFSPYADLVGVEKVQSKVLQFAPKHGVYTAVTQYAASAPLTKRFTKLREAREDLATEIKRAKISARATMDSVRTIDKLIEMWPEIESFSKPYLTQKSAAAAMLPVVQREALNASLGLPA